MPRKSKIKSTNLGRHFVTCLCSSHLPIHKQLLFSYDALLICFWLSSLYVHTFYPFFEYYFRDSLPRFLLSSFPLLHLLFLAQAHGDLLTYPLTICPSCSSPLECFFFYRVLCTSASLPSNSWFGQTSPHNKKKEDDDMGVRINL